MTTCSGNFTASNAVHQTSLVPLALQCGSEMAGNCRITPDAHRLATIKQSSRSATDLSSTVPLFTKPHPRPFPSKLTRLATGVLTRLVFVPVIEYRLWSNNDTELYAQPSWSVRHALLCMSQTACQLLQHPPHTPAMALPAAASQAGRWARPTVNCLNFSLHWLARLKMPCS